MTDMISGMIDYIATDPEGLGMEPDTTGKPALLGGVRRRWPTATDGQIAVAVKSAIIRAQELAAACYSEADKLDTLYTARTRQADAAPVIDFEHERAARLGPWTKWADAPPADDVVVRLRGDVRLAGETVNMTLGGRYCRRGQALCHIESDGSLRLVRPPYDHIEWTPG